MCSVLGSSGLLWKSHVHQPRPLLLTLLTCWHSPHGQLSSFTLKDRQQQAKGTESKGETPFFEDFSAAMAFWGYLEELHPELRFQATTKSMTTVTSKEAEVFLLVMFLTNPG